MPDLVLMHRPALARAKSGSFGATPAGITLTALPEGHVIQVLGASGIGDISMRLRALSDGSAFAVRPAGPEQWLIVGPAPLASGAVAAMDRALEATAALVDQSHGRIGIAISGAHVEAVLAKGSGIDPSLDRFAVGTSVLTMIGHISVHLTRVGDTAFEIIVMRSLAESLWDELIEMSREFGGVAAPA